MSAQDQKWPEFDDDLLQDMELSAGLAEKSNEIVFRVFKPSQAVWKDFEWMHCGGNVVKVVGKDIKNVLSYLHDNTRCFESRISVEIRDRKRHCEIYVIFPLVSCSDGRELYDGDGFDHMIAHFDRPDIYPPIRVINPEYFKREKS